jgi:2-hydroxy-3-keto-5-methylthiopentenyl-1-phosphate phosphatase
MRAEPAPPLPVGAVLVDFDGTACLHDAAQHLLTEFGDPSWPEWDDAWERGVLDGRTTISGQDALLHGDRTVMVDFVRRHCPVDPTFVPFVSWLREREVEIAIVSDGFAFYIEPVLETGNVPAIAIITNEQRWDEHDRPAGFAFPNGHPECVGCGTCKMRAVQRYAADRGPVAFVGEGRSDRYGALYADVTFAKLDLVAICEDDGVPYLPWQTFDDVRASLETLDRLPGPVAPMPCPGWTLPRDAARSPTA